MPQTANRNNFKFAITVSTNNQVYGSSKLIQTCSDWTSGWRENQQRLAWRRGTAPDSRRTGPADAPMRGRRTRLTEATTTIRGSDGENRRSSHHQRTQQRWWQRMVTAGGDSGWWQREERFLLKCRERRSKSVWLRKGKYPISYIRDFNFSNGNIRY